MKESLPSTGILGVVLGKSRSMDALSDAVGEVALCNSFGINEASSRSSLQHHLCSSMTAPAYAFVCRSYTHLFVVVAATIPQRCHCCCCCCCCTTAFVPCPFVAVSQKLYPAARWTNASSSCYAQRTIMTLLLSLAAAAAAASCVSQRCATFEFFFLSFRLPAIVRVSLTHSLTHSQTGRPNSTSLRKQSSPAALNDKTDRGPRIALRTSGPHLSTERRRGAKNRGRGSWHRFKKKKNSPKKGEGRGRGEAMVVTTGST